jgi:hypothetical protein
MSQANGTLSLRDHFIQATIDGKSKELFFENSFD